MPLIVSNVVGSNRENLVNSTLALAMLGAVGREFTTRGGAVQPVRHTFLPLTPLPGIPCGAGAWLPQGNWRHSGRQPRDRAPNLGQTSSAKKMTRNGAVGAISCFDWGSLLLSKKKNDA